MLMIRRAFWIALFGSVMTVNQLAGAIYLRHENVERLGEVKAELDAAGEGHYSSERNLREGVLRSRIDMHGSTILWSSLYTFYFLVIAWVIHRSSDRKQ